MADVTDFAAEIYSICSPAGFIIFLPSGLENLHMKASHSLRGLALLALGAPTFAAPTQIVLDASHPVPIVNKINPLHHLAAISPFFTSNPTPDPLPSGCKLTSVSILIRHSSIYANDEEWEMAMGPFVSKLKELQKREDIEWPEGKGNEWAFLKKWRSPIEEKMLEELSENGKKDAKTFGKNMRNRYHDLFPPKSRKSSSSLKSTPYKVWTASSSRDVESAKSYIRGAFPPHQAGPDGEGDGDVLQLVKVPNKEVKEWDRSLTPHKVCPAFEKESSLEPAQKWLHVFATRVRQRLASVMPGIVDNFNDKDVLAMMMLCGYESITSEESPFCRTFTDEEWLDVEYWFDIRYHYMMGYGNPLSPYLGIPWVKTASHLLAGREAHHGPGKEPEEKPPSISGGDKLPKPKLPPNGTHTQLLHPFFTHRESPAFVATALNLFNSTSLSSTPSSVSPPLDHRPSRSSRQWRTSHLVPFLGHIALERFECGGKVKGEEKESFVWALVNGRHERMTGCENGVGGSCRFDDWVEWVAQRGERWSKWSEACTVPKEEQDRSMNLKV